MSSDLGRIVKIGPPRLTKYEIARVVGARALQISMGAPILIKVPPNVKDPVKIAMLELKQGVIPMVIKRMLPDGRYQDLPVSLLVKSSLNNSALEES